MANNLKIDSLRDFTDKGLRELESWLEPWFIRKKPGGGAGGEVLWEDVGTDNLFTRVPPRALSLVQSSNPLVVGGAAGFTQATVDFSAGVSTIVTNDRTGSYETNVASQPAWTGSAFDLLASGSADRLRLHSTGMYMWSVMWSMNFNYGMPPNEPRLCNVEVALPNNPTGAIVFPTRHIGLVNAYVLASTSNVNYVSSWGGVLHTSAPPTPANSPVRVTLFHDFDINLDYSITLSIVRLNDYKFQ
jgi:hypothetical protein